MTRATAPTSREHYKKLDAKEQYALIRAKMSEHPDVAWCIADLGNALNQEKSTISARLNEMYRFGELAFAGTRPSHSTGINAKHYKLKPSL
jgi:hypothetical protein